MKRLFIDMDGTLAEWQEGTPFEIVCENGYAANLPVNGNMVDATKSLVKLCHKKGVEVFILSAVLDLSHSIPDKDKWLDNVLPGVFDTEHRLYVPYGMNKAEFVMQKLDANKTRRSFRNVIFWMTTQRISVSGQKWEEKPSRSLTASMAGLGPSMEPIPVLGSMLGKSLPMS